MKNKIALLIMTILMLGLMSGIVSAADNPYLTTTLMKYEPQPAEPGKYVKVYIKVENLGSKAAENVLLEIIPEHPFSIDPGRKISEDIGLLGAKNFHVAEFDIKVDKDTTEGTNKLKVRYNIDSDRTTWAEKELDITVQTQDTVISVDSIKTSPSEIIPGEKGTIKIKISNLADSFISDLSVSLDLSSDTLLFAPIDSASEKNIYQLGSKESKEFEFKIIAYPDISAGIYKIPLTIEYRDNVGNEYIMTDVVGVIVNSEPDIKVVVDSTDLLTDKKTGEVVLKIINKGLTDVKFMNLKMIETDSFEVLSSSNEEYIGNLDSDDFETVEYKLFLKGNGEIEIPLELEYRDNNNKLYKEDFMLNLKLYSADKLGQQKSSTGWIVIVIIIIIAGIIIYRRKKNNKRRKKKQE